MLHLVFASVSQKFPGIDYEQALNAFASKAEEDDEEKEEKQIGKELKEEKQEVKE
jgi:hypothetical protein